MKTNRPAAADKLKAHSARMLRQVKSGLRPKAIVSKVIGPFSPRRSDVVTGSPQADSQDQQSAASAMQPSAPSESSAPKLMGRDAAGEGPKTVMSDTVTSVEPSTSNSESAAASAERAATARRAGARHVLKFEAPLSELEEKIFELEALQLRSHVDYTKELRELRGNYTALLRKTYDNLRPWETVQVARHPQRPLFKDYVEMICRDFRELHGDRNFGDDPAIMCGLARLGGHKVMLIGHHKGRDTKEKIACSFGLAHPEGYRKALRCMKLAEKYELPVVTLVDTAGAYPGIGAEERGQAESIARNMFEMSRLRTPILTVITGEGGSGGALGIAVADRVAMMEFAWYSVISPEGCSGILWKGSENAADAAEALKLTSKHLKQLGVIDHTIAEPLGGAHRDPHSAAHNLEQYVAKALRELKRFKLDNLIENRYQKFRDMGDYIEPRAAAKSAG